MRISLVQYDMKKIKTVEDFRQQLENYIKLALDFKSQVLVFPEFLTLQFLSMDPSLVIGNVANFTSPYKKMFTKWSKETGLYIVGGTHIIEESGKLYNAAHLFTPEGDVWIQKKMHVTPSEREDWNISAGDELHVFSTPYGNIAILTCYDMEFPELGRIAREKGADVLLCPSCTEEAHGFYRVRYSCHARAIENELYVAVTGTVGSLPIDGMRLNYAQAAVITPNDIPFPPKGIVVEGNVNEPMMITGDVDIHKLHQFRQGGTVTTWQDRRSNLY